MECRVLRFRGSRRRVRPVDDCRAGPPISSRGCPRTFLANYHNLHWMGSELASSGERTCACTVLRRGGMARVRRVISDLRCAESCPRKNICCVILSSGSFQTIKFPTAILAKRWKRASSAKNVIFFKNFFSIFSIISFQTELRENRLQYFYSVFDPLSIGITLATLQVVSRAHIRVHCFAAGWDGPHTTRYFGPQVLGKLPSKKNMLCSFVQRISQGNKIFYRHTSEKVKTGLKCENCRFLLLKLNYFALN